MAEPLLIDHIALYVTDLQKAEEFFVRGLGLKVTGRYEGEVFLSVGSQTIALFKTELPISQSVNHIALRISSLDETYKAMEALGYKVVNEFVTGPDSIRIQLMARG